MGNHKIPWNFLFLDPFSPFFLLSTLPNYLINSFHENWLHGLQKFLGISPFPCWGQDLSDTIPQNSLGIKAFFPDFPLPEPHDPKEKENFQLLVLLNDRFQALWNFMEENSRILKGKHGSSESSGCIQDFYILWKGDLLLSLYIQ